MQIVDHVVPIIKDSKIEATGFIVHHQEFFFLITAGHTFYGKDTYFSLEGYTFKFNDGMFFLKEMCFYSSYCYPKFSKNDSGIPQGNVDDISIFSLPNGDWRDELKLSPISGVNEFSFVCYGYDVDKSELAIITISDVETESLCHFQPNDQAKPILGENCRKGFGLCKPGYSGGPIVHNKTLVVGMTIQGTEDKSNLLFFITSDYIIEKLNNFVQSIPLSAKE